MPDDGLPPVLVARFSQLLNDLAHIAAAREAAKTALGKDDTYPTWFAACRQLIAVLSFFEDSDELMPELHLLLDALIDLSNGRDVPWLQKQADADGALFFKDASVHGRCAAIISIDETIRAVTSTRRRRIYGGQQSLWWPTVVF